MATRALCPRARRLRVDGQASGTVGQVSMDMLAVDLTTCLPPASAAKVVLWG